MYAERVLYQLLRFRGARFRVDEILGVGISSLTLRPAPARDRGQHVVLLHGIGSSGAHFAQTAIWWQKHGFTVHMPDLPGHGLSGDFPGTLDGEMLFEALVGWMNQVAPTRFVLMGNSLGGALAWRFAGRHSERVSRLILLSPAVGFQGEEIFDTFIKSLEVPGFGAATRFIQRIVGRKGWYWNVMALPVFFNMNRKAVRDLLATSKFQHLTLQHRLGEVQVPTLVVWGKCDDLLPRSNLAFIKQFASKSVEVLEPEGVGHCPQLDSFRWLGGILERTLS
jgi:pimeloyl-ACP methyl ester carboxylesterase